MSMPSSSRACALMTSFAVSSSATCRHGPPGYVLLTLASGHDQTPCDWVSTWGVAPGQDSTRLVPAVPLGLL
jgi:hypothetical protein